MDINEMVVFNKFPIYKQDSKFFISDKNSEKIRYFPYTNGYI